MTRTTQPFTMLVLVLYLAFGVNTSFAQSSSVDLAIAINGSGSISTADFAIQKQGITYALNNPLVFPRNGSIGFTLVQYGNGTTRVHVPYTVINSEAVVQSIINQVNAVTQISGGTNPGDGILTAMSALNAGGAAANKKIICLSTDGVPNEGVNVGPAIATAKAQGLDRFGVIAIEDPPFAMKSDFEAVYNPLIFGGGSVTVVTSFLEYAIILGTSCLTGDVELIGLETTQVIQDWENTIPLIERKQTVVRAHLQSKDSMAVPFQARLIGRRNGADLPGSPLTATNAGSFVAPPQAGNESEIINRRQDIDKSLNFELPVDWTTGTIELQLEGGGTSVECKETSGGTPNDCKSTVTFSSSKVLKVKFLNTSWTDENNTTHAVSSGAFSAHVSQLEQNILSLYPTSKMNITKGRTIFGKYDFGGATPADNPYRQLYIKNNVKLATLQSMEPTRLFLSLVDGPAPVAPAGRVIAISGSTGTMHYKASATTVPHELGHLLGREHAPYCGATAGGAQPFPADNQFTDPADGQVKGAIGPMNKGLQRLVYGYSYLERRSISPQSRFELMSYCHPRWVSDFTYNALKAAIDTRFTDVATFAVPEMLASLDGRKPQGITQAVASYRLFRGIIDLDSNTVEFLPVAGMESNTIPDAPPTGDYQLQLLDGQSKIIKSIDFKPTELFREEPTDPHQAYFTIPVLYNPAVKKAVIVKNGKVVGEKAASKTPPTIKVTYPNGGESLSGPQAIFQWEASDADGDSLTYMVQFSADGGNTWETLDVDVPGKAYEVDLNTLGETQQGLIRVMATDGFNVSSDESDETFITPNNAPEASILTPDEGEVFVGVEPVFFRATARDAEDGDLTGNALSWSSSLDGFLGNGENFFKRASELQEGEHVITLTVTDAAGASIDSTVKIKILRFPPLPCGISTIATSGAPTCEPATNTYSQSLIVSYTNAPDAGLLVVNGQSFPVTASPQTVTLVNLPANGAAVSINAFFSADSTCAFMTDSLFTAPQPCSVSDNAIRINSGGDAYTTDSGKTFMADAYFTGGRLTKPVTGGVANTTSDILYQNGRFGESFSYKVPVTNGLYNVVLHFNETYWGNLVPGGIGSRKFNVNIEGIYQLNDYDITAKAGGAMRAIVETFRVAVKDDTLNIVFSKGSADYARVEALEVLPVVPSFRVNAGGTSWVTSNYTLFSSDANYQGGTIAQYAFGEVAGTTEDELYRSGRYGQSFKYHFPTGNGTFQVILHFNETYWGNKATGGEGSRKFNVDIEGQRKLADFDIYQRAGGAMRAWQESFPVTVTDDTLNLLFTRGSADNPIVSAIEVVSPLGSARWASAGAQTAEASFTVSLAPNPVENKFSVALSMPVSKVTATAIIDAMGRTVVRNGHKVSGSQQLEWEAVQLKAGLYFLRIQAAQSHRILKFLKQ